MEHEVEYSADEVLKEIEEESLGKEYGIMGGYPNLSVSFPTELRIGGKGMVATQEK